MRTLKGIPALAVSVIIFVACGNSSNNRENSNQNWEGVYSNVIPCADCEGIQTTIILNKNMHYIRMSKYLGKSMDIFTDTGRFSWDKERNLITLEGIDPKESPTKYTVEENKLIQMDIDGNNMEKEVRAKYSLEKISDTLLLNKANTATDSEI